MLIGSAPFHHNEYEITYQKIMKLEYQVPDYVSKAAAHFMSKLIVIDPLKRMGLDDLAKHPWLSVTP